MTRNAFYFKRKALILLRHRFPFFFFTSPPKLLEHAEECGRKDCVMLSMNIIYRENNVGFLFHYIKPTSAKSERSH